MKTPEDTRPLLLVNIGQLLTLRSEQPGPRRGSELSHLGMIKDAAVLALAGRLVSIGTTKQARSDAWIRRNRRRIEEIDCQGKVVVPGWVDCHTHPVFMAARLVDFEKRISGSSYEDIAASGGGIRSSIGSLRRAGKGELAGKILTALNEMLAQGTTTVEAKSGYGLSLEAELKSLQSLRLAVAKWPGTVVPTLLGAHVVPSDYGRREYLEMVCGRMIPQAARRGLAHFVDVFCDRGAFSERESEKIFRAAQENGLAVRAHVSQLERTPLARLLPFAPASLDHVDHVNQSDISLLARSNTIATLVPGANYFLGTGRYAPARKLVEAGVAIALATDYNPGSSPTTSMPFVLSLACTQMKLSPAEAIVAATINAAHALRLGARKGSIEQGKDADLALFDVSDYREIPYWIATNRCQLVMACGRVVSPNTLRPGPPSRANLRPLL